MTRRRVFTKMVGKGENQPAIRVEFRGALQIEFLALHRIAEEDYQVKGTALARQILVDWVKQYREKVGSGKVKPGSQQMVMILPGTKKKPQAKE
jgi:hypothetical protein